MLVLLCVTGAYIATVAALSFVVVSLLQRNTAMTILAAFQPALDSLDASATAIAALVAAGTTLPEGAASAQDVTDTLDAVNAKAASVAGALPQPAPVELPPA